MRFPFFGQTFRVCPPVCIPGSCFSIFLFPSFRLLLFVCLSLRFFLPFFLSFPLSFPFCFSCFSFCLFFSSLAIRNPSAYADEFRKEEGLDFCFCLCVCLRFCISLFFCLFFVCFPVCFFLPVSLKPCEKTEEMRKTGVLPVRMACKFFDLPDPAARTVSGRGR